MESIKKVIQKSDVKGQLKRVDKKIIMKFNDDLEGCYSSKEEGCWSRTSEQYTGLCWLKYKFTASFQKKDEYQDVIGIHVMPYRIYERHLAGIQKANAKEASFIDQNTDYSNYDDTSANIHICPNNEWQIVLIKHSPHGPHWATDGEARNDRYTLKIGNKYVQEKYYFPRIAVGADIDHILDIFDETDDNDLIGLIEMALDEVRKTQ